MKNGACIQCDVKSCYVAFHVTCGRQAGYLASMKTLGTHGQLKAWCPKHMPASQAEQIQDRQDERSAEQFTMATSTSTTVAQSSRKRKHVEISGTLSARPEPGAMVKSARAHAKSYHFGAPLVPAIIVGRIVEYTQKVKVRTMNDVIERVCRYWSLKREARRGAPLLKRLYLEPWTASNSSKEQSDADRAKRLEYLIMVRNDLERVRMLAELARKREREKLRQANVLKQFVDEFLFPGATTLRVAFDRIKHLDKDSLFQDPVSREQAPDYYDVIKNPLCLAQIDERIDQYRYLLRIDFERDVLLVLDNAMLYNPPGNPYHQRAARMKKAVMPIIAELPESFEPSITQLQALVEVGTDGKDRLESLFAYELDPPRPPTPPPAPKRPRIQISAEEIRTRKEAKAREAKLALLNRPASMRSTRATQAVQEEVQRAAEIARQAEVAARKPIAARRERRHSARPQTDVSQPGTPTSDAEIIPLRRPQKGVAGLVPYSPTNARKRAERVQQTGLEMETVKPRDEFRRFDQGFILPEGSRRRGRPELVAPPPKPKPSRKRDQPKAAAGPSDATEVATAPLQTSEAELAPPKVTHSFQSPPETSQGPPATQQPAEPEQAPPQASGPSVADAVPPAPSAQEAVRAPSPALSDLTTLSSLSSLSDVGPEPKVANGAEPTTVPELRNVSEQSNITEPVVMPDRERKSQKQATVPPSRKSTRKNYAQSASNSGPVPSPPPVSEPTTKSRSTAGPTIHETQADDTQPRASHRLRRAAAAPHDQARAIPAVAADAPVEAAAANSATAPTTDNGEKANNVMPRASVRVRRDAVDKGDAARTAAEVPQDTPANVAISGSAANAATDKDQPNDLFATKASSHARRGVASPDYQSFANATSSASKSSARQGTPERPVSADAIAEENHAIMPHATEAAAQVTSSTTTSTVTPSNRPKRSAARTVPAEAAVSNREQNEAASSGSSSLTTPSALPQRSKRGRAPAKPAVAEANEGKPSQQAQGTPASSSLSEVPSDLSAAAAEVINVAEQAIEAVKAKAPPAAKESRSSKRKVTGPEAVATEVDASENPAEGSARKKGKQPANSRKVHAEAASDDATRKNRLESLKGTNGTTPSNGWIDPYPEGTLVWAKREFASTAKASLNFVLMFPHFTVDGFPHYPAEVVSATDDYDDIPETVWTARPRSNEADDKGERLWLVRFYDNHQSYGWCPVKKLDVLGEDPGE